MKPFGFSELLEHRRKDTTSILQYVFQSQEIAHQVSGDRRGGKRPCLLLSHNNILISYLHFFLSVQLFVFQPCHPQIRVVVHRVRQMIELPRESKLYLHR
jgi:hypothetical protein